MFSTEVRHSGTIVSLRGHVADVRFLSASKEGCAGCGLSAVCGKSVVVEASVPPLLESSLKVGDKVTVMARGATMSAGVRLAVLPLVTFILVLVLSLQLGATELLSVVMALVSVGVVFAVLHVSGKHDIVWRVEEVE